MSFCHTNLKGFFFAPQKATGVVSNYPACNSLERNEPGDGGGGGGGYSLIWAIGLLVCAAPKGIVFQSLWS